MLLLVAVSGCGTSAYNSQVERAFAILRNQAKFQGLYAPTQIPETPYSVRVPVIFTNSYSAKSSHPDDGDTIHKQRMYPPFLPSNAIKLTYEGMTTDNEGAKLPYYCYLAVAEAKPGDADKLATTVISGLRQAMPGSKEDWEPVDADTPEGKAISWRKLRLTGDQPFFVKKDDKVETRKLPGIFELWMHDAGDHIVMIGWRTPSSIQGPQKNEFTVVGGIAVPTDNAKPDFDKWPVLTAGTLTEGAPVAAAPAMPSP
jgi:hypothetical protein